MAAMHSWLRMAFKFSLRRWRIEMTLLLLDCLVIEVTSTILNPFLLPPAGGKE